MPVSPNFDQGTGFDAAWFAAYKHIYNPRKVQRLVYNNRPFLEMLKKQDVFEGDSYAHTIFFEDPQGGSQTFTTAIAQKQASSQGARFTINRGREYQALSISNEAIAASRSDKGSLLRKKVSETDRILSEMSRRIDIAIHGQGAGILASFTTGGALTGTTITLDKPALGVRFSVGMYVQFASNAPTDGTAPTLLASGAALQIIGRSVTSSATTLTLSAALNTITGLATTTQYYLVRSGCGLGFGTANTTGGVSGLKAWIPPVAPTPGESFWGYDRTVDAQRLSGTRYPQVAAEKYEVTLQNCSAELELQGSNPGVVLMNPKSLSTYSQELGTKARYIIDGSGAPQALTGMKTSGIIIQGQSGQMAAVSDPQVDPGEFYMLDMDTWWLATLYDVPHLDTSDGRSAMRESTGDSQEIRWRAWYQLICDAPGKNAWGQFGY